MRNSSARRRTRSIRVGLIVSLLPVLMAAGRPSLTGQEDQSGSADAVKQLSDAMAQKKLTAIAARHPSEPDRYVAAMLFPGVQLLVISARSSAPAYVDAKIAAGAYSDVYAALQQGIDESKLFIQDMGADGLRGTRGGTADIVYRKGREQTVLNGDHRAAKMSEDDYRKLAADTERQYAELLRLLSEAASSKGQGTGTIKVR